MSHTISQHLIARQRERRAHGLRNAVAFGVIALSAVSLALVAAVLAVNLVEAFAHASAAAPHMGAF